MKIVMLGGAGNQGLFSVKELLRGNVFDEIVLASRNIKKNEEVAKSLNSERISVAEVDVFNEDQLLDLIKDADVVANCTGPYYLLGEPVIDAAIKAGKNYVDFCDDVVVHERIFNEERQKKAKEKGISIIVGIGASPGLLPIMATYGATHMDKVEDVNLYMAIHAEDSTDGPAVALHTIENFAGEVAVLRDGEIIYEHPLLGEEMAVFPEPIGEKKVATMGHPEVFSLPRVMDVENVNIKLGTYPTEAFDIMNLLLAVGLGSTEPLDVKGQSVIPRDFMMALTGKGEEKEKTVETPLSSMYAEVIGSTNEDEEITYRLDVVSQMGPMTGIPLAACSELLAKGKIKKKGIMVPEECLDSEEFITDNLNRIKDAGYPIKVYEKLERKQSIF